MCEYCNDEIYDSRESGFNYSPVYHLRQPFTSNAVGIFYLSTLDVPEGNSEYIERVVEEVDGQEKTEGPDLALLRAAVEVSGDTPVICEGRIHTPEQAAQAMKAGAFAIVVGTAITHPTSITGWFVDAIS